MNMIGRPAAISAAPRCPRRTCSARSGPPAGRRASSVKVTGEHRVCGSTRWRGDIRQEPRMHRRTDAALPDPDPFPVPGHLQMAPPDLMAVLGEAHRALPVHGAGRAAAVQFPVVHQGLEMELPGADMDPPLHRVADAGVRRCPVTQRLKGHGLRPKHLGNAPSLPEGGRRPRGLTFMAAETGGHRGDRRRDSGRSSPSLAPRRAGVRSKAQLDALQHGASAAAPGEVLDFEQGGRGVRLPSVPARVQDRLPFGCRLARRDGDRLGDG